MPKPQPRPVDTTATQEQIADEAQTDQQSQAAEQNKPTRQTIRDRAMLSTSEKKTVANEEEKILEPVEADLSADAVKEVKIETDLYTAVFTNEGAALKSFILKNYMDDEKNPLDLVSEKVRNFTFGGIPLYPFHFSPFEGNETFLELNSQKYFYDGLPEIRVTDDRRREIIFEYKNMEKNVSVFKKFVFSNKSYVIGLDYEVVKDGKELDVPFVFGPDLENNVSPQRAIQMGLKIRAYDGSGDEKDLLFMKQSTEPTNNENIERAEGLLGSNFVWAAYERAYFAAVFKTSKRNSSVRYYVDKEKIEPAEDETEKDKKEKRVEFYSYIIVTNPGMVFLGPKDEDILEKVKDIYPDVDIIIEYGFGFLGSIAKILLKGINLVHSFVPNYGWAIVVFTIFLKILLFPLTYASSVSMAKMQTLQPKIKAIKKKYKNMRDPEQRRKMNEETMQLYKREKVNPASGCLPMLLQLPILFAFFALLRTCINVRHEPWILWITDLSLKDPIYLLPILMGITQLIVQMMSPSGAEGSQKKMMYIMPVVITFFVMSLPSGLTLYWFASNLLQIGQQHIINKKIFSEKKEEEKMKKVLKRKKGVKK
jgi:YidC/Oxa1 family membrane protein insertase